MSPNGYTQETIIDLHGALHLACRGVHLDYYWPTCSAFTIANTDAHIGAGDGEMLMAGPAYTITKLKTKLKYAHMSTSNW